MGRFNRSDPGLFRHGLRHDPLNIYLFLVGLIGWFAVGVLWRDKAIMLIHIIALAAMIVGLTAGET